MSRIHDALNRAEQERGLLQSVDLELERSAEAAAAGAIPESLVEEATPVRTSTPLLRDTVLAACPPSTWTPDPSTMLFSGGDESDGGREEFRALRSRRYQVREGRPLKSVLITSALPGEGKSFVAANLAQVLALQPETRVLLIDADLRSPRVHMAFGASGIPGLSEYLLQQTEEAGIMQRGQAENLFLIPAGRPVSGPTELIANGRLESLVDRVGALFDWIIVDSPAAIPVSDACSLAGLCDGVLLVVRSHSTPFDVVRKARARFREESLLGVVLNGMEPEPVQIEYRPGSSRDVGSMELRDRGRFFRSRPEE